MFEDITPALVQSYTSVSISPDLELVGEEQAAAANFSDRRLRSFAHGRYCARRALAGLGIGQVSIGVGESREPLWPPGIVGSITHSTDLAAAAVCRDDVLVGLGIDCEQADRLDASVIKRVCRADELAALEKAGFGLDHAAVLFSAKESVYKCIWPSVRRFVDFLDVSITLYRDSQRFSAAAASEAIDADLLSSVDGRWALDAGHVYTVACRAAEPRSGF